MSIPKVKFRVSTCSSEWVAQIKDDMEYVRPGEDFQERLITAGEKLKARWVAVQKAKAQLNK